MLESRYHCWCEGTVVLNTLANLGLKTTPNSWAGLVFFETAIFMFLSQKGVSRESLGA